MATNCTISSITLTAGQQFVLPPGATLLGATNVDAITSDCDLPTLETSTCFIAILAGYNNSNGNTEYFEKQTQNVIGYELNSSYTTLGPYPNANSQGSFYPGDIVTGLASSIPSIIGTATGIQYHSTNGENSQTYVVIKTFPSIGNNHKLVLTTAAPMDSGQESVTFKVQFITLLAAADAGYTGLPACP